MSNSKLAKLLIEALPSGEPNLFNPFREICADDVPHNDPEAKLARLAFHLACEPLFILCGEAPSYRGCRHSGIAFTSECLLLDGRIPRIPPLNHRLTRGDDPYSERSAQVVWDELYTLGIQEHTILWNALQMHPHKPGEEHSNRRPKSSEIKKFGKPALQKLVDEFPSATVVAVGKTAEQLLISMGIRYKAVRHPAHGGEDKFRQGLKSLVSGAPAQY
jgi:uracil DNA glycosylase superfamily protein